MVEAYRTEAAPIDDAVLARRGGRRRHLHLVVHRRPLRGGVRGRLGPAGRRAASARSPRHGPGRTASPSTSRPPSTPSPASSPRWSGASGNSMGARGRASVRPWRSTPSSSTSTGSSSTPSGRSSSPCRPSSEAHGVEIGLDDWHDIVGRPTTATGRTGWRRWPRSPSTCPWCGLDDRSPIATMVHRGGRAPGRGLAARRSRAGGRAGRRRLELVGRLGRIAPRAPGPARPLLGGPVPRPREPGPSPPRTSTWPRPSARDRAGPVGRARGLPPRVDRGPRRRLRLRRRPQRRHRGSPSSPTPTWSSTPWPTSTWPRVEALVARVRLR